MTDTVDDAPRRSEAGGKKLMADRDTPLLMECWYVAAWGEEVGRQPLERWLLGYPVVLYRTSDRKVVALHNRCAHRSMPLSKGRIEGDNLVCGYHGLVYEPSGACIRVPTQPKAPKNLCVKAYPVVERGPVVWIWMGSPSNADPKLIPDVPWLSDEGWAYTGGYTHIKANYIRLHENLLDTSHFTFLHPGNVGTPEFATAPYTTKVENDRVQKLLVLKDSTPPPVYAWPMGIEGKRVDRHSDAWFISPALHVAHARIVVLHPAPDERTEYRAEVIHFLTPESTKTTHYFWAQARDFAQRDVGVLKFKRDALTRAFKEDADALEWIEELYDRDPTPGFEEVSVAADAPGVQMRRIIQRKALEEQQRAGSATVSA